MARIKLLGVRFSAGEFVRIWTSAEAQDMTPTAWVRHQALLALEGNTEPPAWKSYPSSSGGASEKLTHTAAVRLTAEQFEALAIHTRRCRLTISAFLRKVVLGIKPVARVPADHQMIVAVNRVGTNLNQLVKLANSGVILAPDLVQILHEVRAEVRAVSNALLNADCRREPSALAKRN
jgi:hypothetical protein